MSTDINRIIVRFILIIYFRQTDIADDDYTDAPPHTSNEPSITTSSILSTAIQRDTFCEHFLSNDDEQLASDGDQLPSDDDQLLSDSELIFSGKLMSYVLPENIGEVGNCTLDKPQFIVVFPRFLGLG